MTFIRVVCFMLILAGVEPTKLLALEGKASNLASLLRREVKDVKDFKDLSPGKIIDLAKKYIGKNVIPSHDKKFISNVFESTNVNLTDPLDIAIEIIVFANSTGLKKSSIRYLLRKSSYYFFKAALLGFYSGLDPDRMIKIEKNLKNIQSVYKGKNGKQLFFCELEILFSAVEYFREPRNFLGVDKNIAGIFSGLVGNYWRDFSKNFSKNILGEERRKAFERYVYIRSLEELSVLDKRFLSIICNICVLCKSSYIQMLNIYSILESIINVTYRMKTGCFALSCDLDQAFCADMKKAIDFAVIWFKRCKNENSSSAFSIKNQTIEMILIQPVCFWDLPVIDIIKDLNKGKSGGLKCLSRELREILKRYNQLLHKYKVIERQSEFGRWSVDDVCTLMVDCLL